MSVGPAMLRRVVVTAATAILGAAVFQFFATLLATLMTQTSGFGAPLAAGSANFAVAGRPSLDPPTVVIDLLVTAAVFFLPAWRSAFVLGVAVFIGLVLFALSVVGLSNATVTVSHVAWWIIAMLPAVVLGALPRIVDL